MLLTNLTANDYVLGRTGLSLEPSDTLTVVNDSYLADTDLRSDINTLYAASKISVSGGPAGFPVSANDTDFELFNGGFVSIGNGVDAPLTWTNPDQNELLDLTTPTLPTVLESGTYAFSVSVSSGAVTVGGYFQLTLQLDSTGLSTNLYTDSRASVAADQNPTAAIAGTCYLNAGEGVAVRVRNKDGVASRNFNISTAIAQKIR